MKKKGRWGNKREPSKELMDYVKSITVDCPMFPPDSRQGYFFGVLDGLKQGDPDIRKGKIIGMKGFPASYVDLGYLQGIIEKAVAEKKTEYGDRGTKELVVEILCECVQRLKSFLVKWDTKREWDAFPETLVVEFSTKDDNGYYNYKFYVHFPEKETES